jgi:hypothetical protein
MAESQNTYTAFIDPRYTFAQRRQIGEAIVGFIKKRAGNKKGIGGARFKNYEKSYADSKEFKLAGKTRNNPNLKLFGQMLDNLKVLDVSLAGRVVVGFDANTRSNDKSVWVEDKGFRFVGLSKDELTFITARFTIPTVTDQDIIQQIIAVRQPEVDEDEEEE